MTRDNLEEFELQIESALAGLAPASTFEDRLAARLRHSMGRMRLPGVNPLVLRSAMGIAATLAVAAIGYIGMQTLEPDRDHAAVASRGRGDLSVLGAPAAERFSNENRFARGSDFAFQAGAFKGVLRDNTRTELAGKSLVLADEVSDHDKRLPSSNLETRRVPAETEAVNTEGRNWRYFYDSLGYSLTTPAKLPETSPRSGQAGGDVSGVVATPEVEQIKQTTAPADPALQKPADSPAIVVGAAQKIIRIGSVEFEVQSFDASFATLATIVAEEGGLVGSTESTKLENGKTRGTIVVRVPPENLDRLITKLRGLGELKHQNISAQDVTKHYTDVESQLRAALAMQERLLEMIKSGQGAIKDLLAAEKELGNWRTKIEQLEGERRYLDAQVAMSTLSITLTETNIAQAAAVTRSETVNTGIECDDVEKARAAVLTKIQELGGRVVSADLKQLDAGQLSATIVAEVNSESSGELIDRLKQVGRVARLSAERAEKASDGAASPTTAPKVESRPSTFQISLYNLANIAPRVTQTLTLAAGDVENAYRSLIDEANKLGGKVVVGQMTRPQPDSVSATIRIDLPSDRADAFLATIKSIGVVMSSSDSQSTDTTNVTSAKRGFSLSLIDIATVPPRETVNASVRVDSAGNALAVLLGAVQQAGGKVMAQSHNRDAGGLDNATATVDVPATASPAILQSLQSLGKVESIGTSQDPNVPAGQLARARYQVQLATAEAIAPRDGFWNSVRNGLGISLRGLGYSLQLIIVGLCLVAPWALLVWMGMKLRRRMKARNSVAAQ